MDIILAYFAKPFFTACCYCGEPPGLDDCTPWGCAACGSACWFTRPPGTYYRCDGHFMCHGCVSAVAPDLYARVEQEAIDEWFETVAIPQLVREQVAREQMAREPSCAPCVWCAEGTVTHCPYCCHRVCLACVVAAGTCPVCLVQDDRCSFCRGAAFRAQGSDAAGADGDTDHP